MQSRKLESNELEESQRSCLMVSFACSSSLLDDYIGMESCVDLCVMKENGNDVDRGGKAESKLFDKWSKRRMMKNREFPPPIPLLARTENLSSHMPWILKRQYTGDGRLILTEEKVKHHEYFRAHRCNGRLTLQLVPLDHDELRLLPPPFSGGYDVAESEFNNVEGEERKTEDQDEIDHSLTMGGVSTRLPLLAELPITIN